MRRTVHPRTGRGGFTLVELLVVVTIIAVMVALTSSAVLNALRRGDDVKLRNDITQLSNSVQAFKTAMHVQYVPDRIVLPPGYDQATALWFKQVWPRLDARTLGTGTNNFQIGNPPRTVNPFTYWQITDTNVPNIFQANNNQVALHGDQVLVFILGGWHQGSDYFGFSSDQTDPMKPYVAGENRKPFFDFPAERLKVLVNGTNGPEVTGAYKRLPGFPSYLDVFERTPYMYFSSLKASNDYTYTHAAPIINGNTGNYDFKLVTAFKTSGNKFANPNGFQIVSAGRDYVFGDGGINWAGATGGALTAEVRDDVANFYQSRLGD